jgi:hypothetical protein
MDETIQIDSVTKQVMAIVSPPVIGPAPAGRYFKNVDRAQKPVNPGEYHQQDDTFKPVKP